jgi:peroxiredoxin
MRTLARDEVGRMNGDARRRAAILPAIMAVTILLGGCPAPPATDEGGMPPPEGETQAQLPPVEITPIEPTPAPDFTLPRVGGGEVSLRDYEGKLLVLDFWATWCSGCVKELPAYQALVDSWDPERVAYLGIALDDSLEQVEAFLKTRPDLKLPMALADERTAQAYLGARRTLPSARVIDGEGMIRYAFSGGEQPARVKAAVEALLREPGSAEPTADTPAPAEP